MKFASAIVALLATSSATASAIPADVQGPQLVPRKMRNTPERLDKRALRKSNLMQPALVGGNVSHVQYSSNWAGAVLVGSGYTSVTASIVVPTPREPSGGNSRTQYAASAWVGIDGDTCGSAILQTGVDFYVQDGSVSFDCWYEWYPGKWRATTIPGPPTAMVTDLLMLTILRAQTTPTTLAASASRRATPSR
jgi:hypothetical protein